MTTPSPILYLLITTPLLSRTAHETEPPKKRVTQESKTRKKHRKDNHGDERNEKDDSSTEDELEGAGEDLGDKSRSSRESTEDEAEDRLEVLVNEVSISFYLYLYSTD